MGNLASGLGLSHGWALRDWQRPPCCVAAAALKPPCSPRDHPSAHGAHVANADPHQAAVWVAEIGDHENHTAERHRTWRNPQRRRPIALCWQPQRQECSRQPEHQDPKEWRTSMGDDARAPAQANPYGGQSGGGGWIRTNVGVRQRIYSPSPLATRAPLHAGKRGTNAEPQPLSTRS
jgi:hypothetical protein